MVITVYISSAGSTNAVNVIRALEQSNIEFRLIGGDCNPLSAGLFLVHEGYIVPRADDPEFIPEVLRICRKEKVDVALPIYSADFPVFRKHIKSFEYNGIATYAPSEKALEICSDKKRVIEYLRSIDVPAPETWSAAEGRRDWVTLPYPVFMKRLNGSGTKGVQKINGQADLEFFLGRSEQEVVFQEYLEGQEYTIDAISDLEGKMLAASPRLRQRVYGGLSVCGETVNDKPMIDFTRRIVEGLKLPGPSNVQCIKAADGRLAFYDINPRFASGGLPLAVAAGVNIPELLIKMLLGMKYESNIIPESGVVMLRYWDSVIVREKE